MLIKKWVLSGMLLLPFMAGGHTLLSPTGNLKLEVDVNTDGAPYYTLTFKDKAVLESSRLGLECNNADLTNGFEIIGVDRNSVDECWNPVWGEFSTVRNNYNEMAISMKTTNDAQYQMTLRFRLFDDGLGFRYEFPEQSHLKYTRVMHEITEFNLPGNPTLYCIPGDYNTDEYLYTTSPLKSLQESLNKKGYNHTESSRIQSLTVQTPLMIKTDTEAPLYINIHEAALRGYAGMSLDVDEQTGVLSTHLTPDRLGVAAYLKMPFSTPWRTVVVSDDACDILASQLIFNLNEPCALTDTSWIKPQKFMGVWWEMFLGEGGTWAYSDYFDAVPGVTDYSKLTPNGRHAANNANVKHYIDFASEHNIDAVLVEGWNEGWEDWGSYNKNRQFLFTKPYPDFDIDALTKYAESKGVKLVMHHETAANAADYERQLDDAFKYMQKYGYNTVKTGYVGDIIPRSEYHSSQWMVDHYIYVAERAAEYGIMVNSHEAVRPTGLCRTYPNWIAQESARGGEFESMGGNPPEHTCILPFTRLMGGPMDYTPGLFEPHRTHVSKGGNVEAGSTLSKQLALYLTMPSPLQMACDLPRNYSKYLDAFKFIEDVPVDWSDSRYLEAEPGDYITVARKDKNSEDWYVGGITDENARVAKINFSFLPKGEKYIATIYEDSKDADYLSNPTGYKIRQIEVTSKTQLKQSLAPGGGFAIRIVKK
ncbi:MAG: glycoside hydrolase family 97 protein [Muribaculaceae bacterium]|nr:glycoside hydrolase family 97 protein [Muribaculaceae bacterium]